MILDSSVAVKWLVPEEHSDAATELIGQGELVVPTLFHIEVANALWKKAMRGEIVLEEVAPHVSELPLLVATLDEVEVVPRALEIAAALGHPIYDCIYLALAEARDDVAVTADVRLLGKVVRTSWAARVKELGT